MSPVISTHANHFMLQLLPEQVVLRDDGSFVNINLGWQESISSCFIPPPNRCLKRWSSPERRRVCWKRSFTCHRRDKQNRSRLTSAGCSYISYDVTSHFSESARFRLIKGAMIDSIIQVSHSGVSIETVITRQILREQFRRSWRGGWRWLMSWGTGNWLWVERAEWRRRAGVVVATFSSLFLFIILSFMTAPPSRGKTERTQTHEVSIHLFLCALSTPTHLNTTQTSLHLTVCILIKRERTKGVSETDVSKMWWSKTTWQRWKLGVWGTNELHI